MIKLTDKEFKEMYTYVKTRYGINLESKRVLIEGRLNSTLQAKGCKTFSDYILLLRKDTTGEEITTFLNKITTNLTFFMREPKHFEYLKDKILPEQEKTNTRKIYRIWSAGCSLGAEAYTTLMTINDYFGVKKSLWRTPVLATDISQSVLTGAKEATYKADLLKDIPLNWRVKYFKPAANKKDEYQVVPAIRQDVEFKVLNLMDDFHFPYLFNLIFCRNVMIYFDQETRKQLVNKYYERLEPGGYLFIGHSETITRDATPFQFIQPAVYRKPSR
ncbi:MAG: protein-glutamate O-methyltransferase CheR [Gracilibacteraceae bacterium]|jgi:chemotaxis protein methyltransferase CheR|nr:protein-glutamate O-methyltransferase CheR [Gracilibacteraceae bacterium]